jgi:hypothetical protein
MPLTKVPVSNFGPETGHQETIFNITLISSGKQQEVPQIGLQSFVSISFKGKGKIINTDATQSRRKRWNYISTHS